MYSSAPDLYVTMSKYILISLHLCWGFTTWILRSSKGSSRYGNRRGDSEVWNRYRSQEIKTVKMQVRGISETTRLGGRNVWLGWLVWQIWADGWGLARLDPVPYAEVLRTCPPSNQRQIEFAIVRPGSPNEKCPSPRV